MAENRINQYLKSIADGESGPNDPRTRDEAMLAKIAAGEEVTEEDRNRFQYWLKKIKPHGEENPNYIETISGTLSSPFGDYTTAQLFQMINSKSASVFMSINLTDLGSDWIGPMYVYAPDITQLRIDGVSAAGFSPSDWAVLAGTYSTRFYCYILVYGSIIELDSDQYGSLETFVSIIHHPMSEETI